MSIVEERHVDLLAAPPPEAPTATRPSLLGRIYNAFTPAPPPPPILTELEQKNLDRFKSRANFLDNNCQCCGIKVGFDPIIGLLPVVGDFAAAFIALYLIISLSSKLELPAWLYFKMLVNVLADVLVGLIPVIGDALDFLFKANLRNAVLLEKYLMNRARKRAQEAA